MISDQPQHSFSQLFWFDDVFNRLIISYLRRSWYVTQRQSPATSDTTSLLAPQDVMSTIPQQQQQQLKKLGIIIHYLDQFNHNRSRGHRAKQRCSRNHWRGLLSFQDFRLGTYGYAAIQLLFLNTPFLCSGLNCGDWLSPYSLESACFPCGLNGS